MFESLRSRFLLATGIALFGAVAFTAIVSSGGKRSEKKDEEAAAVWKQRTGVDLATLQRQHPPQPDSEDARALDALLQPAGLQLGSAAGTGQRPPSGAVSSDEPDALRDYLRAAIRANTTEPQPVPPKVVSLIERHAKTLDAVASYFGAARA